MQGFNKYYPPDYDGEKHGSLNAYRGKHALGDRARKIGQGILIVRFELPFNIWCGTCNNHIGMGVRYNAEKRKIGSYYSTPIYAFRCKCHLCDAWFEIQTDPKNTRYVVTEGARQKDEEWDPAENGGFAVHDTDPNQPPPDPLATLEKTTAAEAHLTQVALPRLTALQSFSDRRNSDPYSLSRIVRKRFREEKKVEAEARAEEEDVKARFGLPGELRLERESEESRREAKERWREERERRMGEGVGVKRRRVEGVGAAGILPRSKARSMGGVATGGAVSELRARILENTARRATAVAGSSRSRPSDGGLQKGLSFRR
ncbi:DUF572-domain-containing protein [Laetiporus sulphureus 93-53]|uniref:DUF572-domain-containing protein n=1 Tax=Laetiporus sulphureus 93-53 TaxID=1314785 RepID=A0A165E2I7_9APHY|nr:DUF572-domain-containing protein [Laetiporus sulphureus 93-53]KZT06121.1 DUF572-domain-containing protein [Laetiporus sulphureus 93-53]